MGIILTILAAIAGFIVVLLIAGLFIKKEYSIEQEIIVDKPKQAVFDYIKMVSNQQNYNKWWMRDPDAKKTFTGTDGTPGFIASWDSNDKHAGKGEQEILKISDGERIDHEIRFERPFKGVAYSYQATNTIPENQTNVKMGVFGRK